MVADLEEGEALDDCAQFDLRQRLIGEIMQIAARIEKSREFGSGIGGAALRENFQSRALELPIEKLVSIRDGMKQIANQAYEELAWRAWMANSVR
jgi:hypothetical protein